MDKENNIKIQKKLAKVFKAVISAGLVASVLISVSACNKKTPAAEVKATTSVSKGNIPTTTTPQTTTTVEATTTTEVEIINAPEIAGLKFDQTTKTYIAEASNPYGLEAGAEAGVYTKEAIKVNGEMEDAIGLKPAVINYFQKQYIKNGDCFFPIIINLNEVKCVEIEETDKADGDTMYYLGVKVPEGTKITPL